MSYYNEPDPDELIASLTPRRGAMRGLGEFALGALGGLGQSVTATGRGLAQIGDWLVPGEGMAHRAVDRLGIQEEALRMAQPESIAGLAGGITGRMGGDIAQIALTGGASRLPTAARGLSAAGRALGVTKKATPFMRGALASVPVAGVQAAGGEESSTAAALAMLGDTEWGQDRPFVADMSARLGRIAENPAQRAAFEAVFDATLGGLTEAGIMAYKSRAVIKVKVRDALSRAVANAEAAAPRLANETGGLSLPTMAEPDRVMGAVVRDPETGELFRGGTHSMALDDAQKKLGRSIGQPGDMTDPNQGFYSEASPFMSRNAARELEGGTGRGLTSEELDVASGPLAERATGGQGVAVQPGMGSSVLPLMDDAEGFARLAVPGFNEMDDVGRASRMGSVKEMLAGVREEAHDMIRTGLRLGEEGDKVAAIAGSSGTSRVVQGSSASGGAQVPTLGVRVDADDNVLRRTAATLAIAHGQSEASWIRLVDEGAEGAMPGFAVRLTPQQYDAVNGAIKTTSKYASLGESLYQDGVAVFQNADHKLLDELVQAHGAREIESAFFRGETLSGHAAIASAFGGDQKALRDAISLLENDSGPVFEAIGSGLGDAPGIVKGRLDGYVRDFKNAIADAPPRGTATRLAAGEISEDAARASADKIAEGLALVSRGDEEGFIAFKGAPDARIKGWKETAADPSEIQAANALNMLHPDSKAMGRGSIAFEGEILTKELGDEGFGTVDGLYDPELKHVYIDWIGEYGASPDMMPETLAQFYGGLGDRQLREVFAHIKTRFPEAQTISGYRIGGVRGEVGGAATGPKAFFPRWKPTKEVHGSHPSAMPTDDIATDNEALQLLKTEAGYIYHGAALEDLGVVAKGGDLPLQRPEDYMQDMWPDGYKGKRLYFTEQADEMLEFPTQGTPIVVRTRKDAVALRDAGDGDMFSVREIPASKMEVLMKDGTWRPLRGEPLAEGGFQEMGLLPTLASTSGGAIVGATVAEEQGLPVGVGAAVGGAAGLGLGAASLRGFRRSLETPPMTVSAKREGVRLGGEGGFIDPGSVPRGVGARVTPTLRRAVGNTDFAEITEDGLAIDLTRIPRNEGAGTVSGMTGVYYSPSSPYLTDFEPIPGLLQGKTVIPRPITVTGSALDAVKRVRGADAHRRLVDDLASKFPVGDDASLRDRWYEGAGGTLGKVRTFLRDHGGDASVAEELVDNATDPRALNSAVASNVIAKATRDAGYDAVVIVNNDRIWRVLDVRESHFPAEGVRGRMHPAVQDRYMTAREMAGLPREELLRNEAEIGQMGRAMEDLNTEEFAQEIGRAWDPANPPTEVTRSLADQAADIPKIRRGDADVELGDIKDRAISRLDIEDVNRGHTRHPDSQPMSQESVGFKADIRRPLDKFSQYDRQYVTPGEDGLARWGYVKGMYDPVTKNTYIEWIGRPGARGNELGKPNVWYIAKRIKIRHPGVETAAGMRITGGRANQQGWPAWGQETGPRPLLTNWHPERGASTAGMTTTLAGAGVGAGVGAAANEDSPVMGAVVGGALGAGLGAGLAKRAMRGVEDVVTRGTDEPLTITLEGARRVPRPEGMPRSFDDWMADAEGRAAKRSGKVFDAFGLDETGRQELVDNVRAAYETGEWTPKVISNAETEAAARSMGMKDVTADMVNKQVDGVTLLGMKNMYHTKKLEVDDLYKELDALGDAGTRAQRLKIEVEIGHKEDQMGNLVEMYLPEASQMGRNLQSLQIAASRQLRPEDEFGWVTKLQKMGDRQLTSDEVTAVRNALEAGDADKLVGVGKGIVEEPGWGKSFINIRRAGFLLGGRTQLRNAISNLGEGAFRQVDSPMAVWFDKLLSQKTGLRTRTHVNPAERLKAAGKGAKLGSKYMGEIISGKRKMSPAEWRKLDVVSRMMKHSRVANGYVDFSYRLQGAVDQPWRMAAFSEAVLEQSKILGKDFEKAFDDAVKSMESGMPDDVAIHAMIEAEEATFQNPTALGSALSAFTNKMPGAAKLAVEYVVPFKQTPASIFTRLVDRSPIGLIDASTRGYTKLLKATDGLDEMAIKQLQRDLSNRVARGVSGTAALTIGGILYLQGKASGSWPSDDMEKQKWMQKGKIPDAINLGDDETPRWGKLTGVSPIGNLIAIGAGIAQGLESANEEDASGLEKVEQAATNMVMVGARTARENTFMRGIDDLLKATDPRYGDTMFERFISSQGQSMMPIPLRDIKDAIDPIYREPDGFVEGFRSVTPMWSMDVPVWQDEFGRARQVTQNRGDAALRFIDPMLSRRERTETDPILKEFDDVGATIPKRQRRVSAGETKDQFRARRAAEGAQELAALEQMIGSEGYERMNKTQKALALRNTITGVREWLTERKPPENWGYVVGGAMRRATRPPRPNRPAPVWYEEPDLP